MFAELPVALPGAAAVVAGGVVDGALAGVVFGAGFDIVVFAGVNVAVLGCPVVLAVKGAVLIGAGAGCVGLVTGGATVVLGVLLATLAGASVSGFS